MFKAGDDTCFLGKAFRKLAALETGKQEDLKRAITLHAGLERLVYSRGPARTQQACDFILPDALAN